ncbi:MAG: DUF4167 domain-containing protein [Proteobacteria bacterium]|nr:DUF4167 domain-containing protein [Pseudomonadota bacterium]
MRPGQQNKRGRGRGSNNNNNNNNNNGNNNNFNRKGQNPLTRTYDSSGPDIKIRGTAQHIAEKYAALARDAQSSGDRVMAENYLQHAEHYNRIIAAAQAQMQERFQREDRNDANDRDGYDRDDDNGDNGMEGDGPVQPVVVQQPAPQRPAPVVIDGTGPQPVIDELPVEVVAAEEGASAGAGRDRNQARRSRGGQRPRRAPRTREGGEGGEGAGEAAPAPAVEVAE